MLVGSLLTESCKVIIVNVPVAPINSFKGDFNRQMQPVSRHVIGNRPPLYWVASIKNCPYHIKCDWIFSHIMRSKTMNLNQFRCK